MAPPKTMTISQQQVAQSNVRRDSGDQSQGAKPRKRKGKQNLAANVEKQPQQVDSVKTTQGNKENSLTKTGANKQQLDSGAVPVERTLIKKQQSQDHQVPPTKKTEPSTIIAKQLSTDEPDDIDAGIELDGSSNSGSSVRDMSDDQSKSTSTSPVMAQTNLVSDGRSTKHAIEMAPIEQVTGSLCTDVTPTSKKIGTTKAQLAANQQVIDADEQLLQQKLQSKQRKSSLLEASISSNRTNTSVNNDSNNNNDISGKPQSPALCKVCEQHVYQMERMLAEKAVYHKRCFRCYQCKIQLRVDNYSSHEGQVYCKAHHRQIFQPQVKLDSEDDVDIVAKSSKYEVFSSNYSMTQTTGSSACSLRSLFRVQC